MKNRYTNANRDPREITAKFDSKCAETGKIIKKGESCIYYPTSKDAFHPDSNQAESFYAWKADLAMGFDY